MTDHVTTHQAEDDARNEDIMIWLNGRVVPKAEAVVSGYDSGFMLGDGVREGLRQYDTGTGHFRSVRDTINQQNDHRRACAVDGDAWCENPSVPTPKPVPARPDRDDHH